jgi:bifunctional autolysin
MAFTETPKEKEKRLAYYAKNRANAKDKEDKADAETARKFNETTNTDTSKNTNPMGDTYKKGGKVMKKKMKKYEGGGSIDEGVRARAMKSVEGLEGIKGSDIEDETGTVKGSIKRNEYGDLYDSEMKAPIPKKAAEKLTPKAEAPTPKEEPKAAPKSKESAFKDSSSSFKDSSSSFKGTPSSFKNNPAALKDNVSSFKETPSSFKDSSSSFKGNAFKNAKSSFKSGGKVSSASKRADGCAIRGKTRA